MEHQSPNELLEIAINKLASFVPEPLSEEVLKQLVVDKVPKAFYYQMLLELLSAQDKRTPEVILTEARFLVKLLLFKGEKKNPITSPKTKI